MREMRTDTQKRNGGKVLSPAAKLFRKMQTRFTVLVAVICFVLVSVSFVAMSVINTIVMDSSVRSLMTEAMRFAEEIYFDNSVTDGAPSNGQGDQQTTNGPRPDCLVVIEHNGDYELIGSLGSEITLTAGDITYLMATAMGGADSTRLGDLRVRIAVDVDTGARGYSLYAFYDFTDRYSIYVSQTLGMMFSFIGLACILTLFSYMMSGVMLSPARDALIRQKELVANASHELKTPVTIINANLDVIKNAPAGADNDKWIANIEAQTKRMNSLIIEMLEMSSFESSAYNAEIKEFDLGEMTEGYCLSFEATCYEKGISMSYESEGGTVVRSDEKGWSKLVSILLDNAVKYSPQNGRIEVRIVRKKKHVYLYVANDGEIPRDKLDKIFDRFYKAGENSNSFGLGLAMAKVITAGMNGSISCSSSDGRTVFTVCVPIREIREQGKENKERE